jgi:hypothetical protein
MHVLPTILLRLSAATLGFCASAAAAEGVLPSINVEASCRASANSVFQATGDKTVATVENCMSQEAAARAQIMKSWDTFSSAEKVQCINPQAYMPSYVEWLTCLETRRDVRGFPKN